jgi:hypothetical protein
MARRITMIWPRRSLKRVPTMPRVRPPQPVAAVAPVEPIEAPRTSSPKRRRRR